MRKRRAGGHGSVHVRSFQIVRCFVACTPQLQLKEVTILLLVNDSVDQRAGRVLAFHYIHLGAIS